MSWNPINGGKEIASGAAPRALIRFTDIDQDGKDDYVVTGDQTGSVAVYFNRGPKEGVNGNWVWDGPHQMGPGAPGIKGDEVLFADINGDGITSRDLSPSHADLFARSPGRPDYLVNKNGTLDAFLNIGKPKSIDGIQWVGAGQVATGFRSADSAMADITGDVRQISDSSHSNPRSPNRPTRVA
ncbi:MAG: hypothetical protein Q9224_003933 [Gallowayella concinna]